MSLISHENLLSFSENQTQSDTNWSENWIWKSLHHFGLLRIFNFNFQWVHAMILFYHKNTPKARWRWENFHYEPKIAANRIFSFITIWMKSLRTANINQNQRNIIKEHWKWLIIIKRVCTSMMMRKIFRKHSIDAEEKERRRICLSTEQREK